MSKFLGSDLQSELVAVDLETKGTNSADPSSFIAGVGFAHSGGCFYIHLLGASDEVRNYIRQWLIGAKRLTSFNVLFDASFLWAFTGHWLNWTHDSYGLFKVLSTEGYPSQRWDLETAQLELLGWGETNKAVLADALKTAGLTKADMWKLSPDILGRYCAIDAEAHYQVLEELLAQCSKAEWGDAVLDYHTRLYMAEVKLLAEQQLRGLTIDQELIHVCHTDLLSQIHASKEAFLTHPSVAPHIDGAREKARDAWMASRPPRWTSQMVQSKNYERWLAREEKAIESGSFNINSKPQLADLFYAKLGHKIAKYTATGKPVVDRKVLPYLGEPGKLLANYNLYLKRRGYVERIIRTSKESGLINPQFNSMGAVSTRLGGSGGVNCFPSTVEILTKRGWVPATEMSLSDVVWQVDPKTLQGSWTHPTDVVKVKHEGELIGFGGERGELLVTPNHRMAWYGAPNQNNKYLGTWEAQEGFPQKRLAVSCSSMSASASHHSVKEIWTALMIQADGSRRKGRPGVVWGMAFKKQRKIDKATELLGPGRPWRDLVIWSYARFTSDLLDPDTKTLRLESLGTEHVQEVLAAVTFWDGYRIKTKQGVRVEYTSMQKENVDQLSAYFCRCGYAVTVRQYYGCWRLIVNSRAFNIITKKDHIRRIPFSGDVGCVSVPTGHILVRSGGRTWVTGNCQQLYKDPAFLAAFRARPGFKLVQADAEALEPTILAEFSQDKTLLAVYGKDAKPSDIYLYVAAKTEALGREIRKHFDPDHPTPESIKLAKKLCKRDRAVAKKFHLMSAYKAGPAKIKEDLELEGINLSLKEVRAIHQDYWNLFRGVLRFEEKLQSMWMANGGWIPSIFGTPIAVADSLLKDINNRFCQYSGHVVLQLWIYYIETLRHERGVEMYPWLVDGHDDTVWEAPEEQAQAAAQVIDDALVLANEELGMEIPIKGPSMIVDNLAEVKCENYQEWLEARTKS